MSENKRFIIPKYPDCIVDTVKDKEYKMSSYYTHIFCICDLLNNLYDENDGLKQKNDNLVNIIARAQCRADLIKEENKQLKEHIKSLEKQMYLIHMQSMFSTVKSFKGDVSKRYKYSEETDTIYDTANKYGQLNKILDKKEITMLLNEYETILKELEE